MMSRVIPSQLCAAARVAGQELLGVVRLAELFGFVGIQSAAVRVQAIREAARPLVDDIAWSALTGSIRVTRRGIDLFASRIDRLAGPLERTAASRPKGAFFKSAGLGARFLFP